MSSFSDGWEGLSGKHHLKVPPYSFINYARAADESSCKVINHRLMWGSRKYDRELNVIKCIFQINVKDLCYVK